MKPRDLVCEVILVKTHFYALLCQASGTYIIVSPAIRFSENHWTRLSPHF